MSKHLREPAAPANTDWAPGYTHYFDNEAEAHAMVDAMKRTVPPELANWAQVTERRPPLTPTRLSPQQTQRYFRHFDASTYRPGLTPPPAYTRTVGRAAKILTNERLRRSRHLGQYGRV